MFSCKYFVKETILNIDPLLVTLLIFLQLQKEVHKKSCEHLKLISIDAICLFHEFTVAEIDDLKGMDISEQHELRFSKDRAAYSIGKGSNSHIPCSKIVKKRKIHQNGNIIKNSM